MKVVVYLLFFIAAATGSILSDFLEIFLGHSLTSWKDASVPPTNVKMYLFTHENPTNPILLTIDNAALINSAKPVKILIHGWLNHGFMNWLNKTRNAYLNKNDYNVVQVDWSSLAIDFYTTAVIGTSGVGSVVADYILKSGVPLKDVHMVGHSLGAQTAGAVGRAIKNKTGQLIGRITGLDPAGPLYELIPIETKLSKNDATIVDIIHTDGGKMGMFDTAGTVDFYPNGGTFLQPGCPMVDTSGLEKTIDIILYAVSCSHYRSVEFFMESIDSLNFVATKCSRYIDYKMQLCSSNEKIIMGEHVPATATGVFYLQTDRKPPYALG